MPATPAATMPRRRLWRWATRLLVVLAVLLLLFAVFHRPLILAAVQWAGPKAAATQGLPLTWQVGGSLWSDFSITALRTGGGEGHWLPRASLGRLEVGYDPRAALEHLVKGITLHDLDADLDLRHLPAPQPGRPDAPPQAPSAKAPPLVWPEFIDLRNLSANVILADGRRVAVRGLSLQMGRGMPGVLQCRELRVEPDGPHLESLSAKIDWQPRLIVIRGFTLPKDVVLDELRLDLGGFENGTVAAQILAHLGAARFSTQAQATGIFGDAVQVKAQVQASELRALELRTLGLPQGVEFDGGSLRITAEGDPARPPQLKVSASLEAANLRAAGAMLDSVALDFAMQDAQAALKSLRLIRGGNRVEVSARARLPGSIQDWQKTTWSATTSASITDLAQLLVEPPPLRGVVAMDARADGSGTTPTRVSGTLRGADLRFAETCTLPGLDASFTLDGREARIEIPRLPLGDGNELALKAAMRMQDAMPVSAEWRLRVHQPDHLVAALGLPAPPLPLQGRLDLDGSAAFTVREAGEGDFEALTAGLALKLAQARYGGSPLPDMDLAAKAQDGRLRLSPCIVRVDAENHLEVTATADLKAPFVFSTQGVVTMPQLARLSTLLSTLGAPQIQSGRLSSRIDARGALRPWRCEGTAIVDAANVHPANLPQPAGLRLDAAFAGTTADIRALEAQLGPWRLALAGQADERSVRLSQLKVWQKDTLLVHGRASAPLDITRPTQPGSLPLDLALKADGLKLHEVLQAAGIQGLPPGVLHADIALRGRLETLDGTVKISLRDVQAPQAPKAFSPASVDLDTTLRAGLLKTAVKVLQPPLQPLILDAQLPVDLPALAADPASLQRLPLQAALRLAESDLAFLREYAPDLVRSLPAKLRLDAQVTGTLADPRLRAALDLHVPELAWMKADMPSVRDVRLRLRAQDRTLRIEDLSLMLAGGRVRLGGTLDAADLAAPALNLKLEAREALVFRDPTTSLRANADITCAGTLARARVAGLVEAVRGRIFQEIDLMPVLKLPADVPPVPADTTRSTARLQLPPPLKDWTFDLRVRTRDPLLVSGNLANGAISADVLLGGTGAAPRLTGGANIDRLLLKLPFSLVKITKGVVTLNPEKPFDPALDIRGESRVGSSDITLYVYGVSSQPKTRFTSTPPMSEADIVTLLGTGTTLGGSGSDLAAEAASRAAFLFLSELYRKTFNKKKIVRQEPPRLHMTFNPSGADRGSDSVQAAYDLGEHWRVTARFTQAGRMKALLGWVLRFGRAAQAVDAP